MKKKFNLSAYKKLLELKTNGKISRFPTDENSRELLRYQASVDKQISYNRKADYFLLIHEYLTRVISLHDFTSKLTKMDNENAREAKIILGNFQKLEEFFLVEDLDKFCNLIDPISNLCFDYYEDWDGTLEPMTEAEFYNLVHHYYLPLQEAFPFENFTNQAYEHLVSRSFKFLLFTTVGFEILITNFK